MQAFWRVTTHVARPHATPTDRDNMAQDIGGEPLTSRGMARTFLAD